MIDEDDWEVYDDDAPEPGVRISLVQDGHVLVFRLTHLWSFCFKRASTVPERYLAEGAETFEYNRAVTMPSNWAPA